jgi:hypothetical protein
MDSSISYIYIYIYICIWYDSPLTECSRYVYAYMFMGEIFPSSRCYLYLYFAVPAISTLITDTITCPSNDEVTPSQTLINFGIDQNLLLYQNNATCTHLFPTQYKNILFKLILKAFDSPNVFHIGLKGYGFPCDSISLLAYISDSVTSNPGTCSDSVQCSQEPDNSSVNRATGETFCQLHCMCLCSCANVTIQIMRGFYQQHMFEQWKLCEIFIIHWSNYSCTQYYYARTGTEDMCLSLRFSFDI